MKLIKLLKVTKIFLSFAILQFDWFVFKEHRVNAITESRKLNSKKTVVTIFVDSLDRRIFDLSYMRNLLPNLFRLYNRSVLFTGFTSSASWTYPVLSSIYSGINSAIDLRLWRNSWPLDIFNDLELSHFDKKEVRQVLLSKNHEYICVNDHNPFMLTKIFQRSKYIWI